MSSYLYYIGKAYPFAAADEAIRKRGYKVGLLHDSSLPLSQKERYDTVVDVDFSDQLQMKKTLANQDLQAAGLLCTYENYLVAEAVIAKQLGVASNSLEAAQKATDKYLMRQAFIDEDPEITPRFGIISSLEEALSLAESLTYPVIIKPTNLVKSLLVLTCHDDAELRKNVGYALSVVAELYEKYKVYDRKPGLIIEEYIEGRLCSIAAFVDESGTPHFCDGVVKLVNASERGVDDNYLYSRILPARLSESLTKQLFNVARKGVRALGMRSTPAHIELIYSGESVKIIEIGARTGGYRPRMYQASYGIDLLDAEVQLAIGQAPQLAGSFSSFSAVYELFPEKEGRFQSITNLREVKSYTSYREKVQAGQKVGPARLGYKACAVIVITEANEDRFQLLCRSVDNLKVVVS